METLRNYLNNMFKRYPETPEAARAKAELWQMMEDKYNELIADGKKENEAVGIVIAEFGDLEEVADTLGIATMLQRAEPAADRAQSAAQGTASAFDEAQARFGQAAEERRRFADEAAKEAIGDAHASFEQSTDGTWQRSAEDARSGAWWTWHNDARTAGADSGETIYRLLTGVLSVFWPTVTCIYLCWSFLTFRWWLTWIIWPLAAILHSVLKRLILGDVTARDGRVYKSRLIAAVLDSYWPCVVFVYFAVSFMTGAWGVTWLIYIIAPFIRNILKRMSLEEGVAES